MKFLCRTSTILVGLSTFLLVLVGTAPSAFALRLLEEHGPSTPASPSTAAHGGIADWEITLIGVDAVAVAAAFVALTVRLRAASAPHSAGYLAMPFRLTNPVRRNPAFG
jgi:hypothetical protein